MKSCTEAIDRHSVGIGTFFIQNTLGGFESFEKLALNLREFQVSVRDFPKMLVHKKLEAGGKPSTWSNSH